MSEAPLEDLMVAMDVVDTVRHRELLIDRELDASARRRRLLDRLREIYGAQGIEVTDAALQAGVDALEQERFRYAPTPESLSAKLARLYVRRDKWLKPIALVVLAGVLIWGAWFISVEVPQRRDLAALPASIETTYARIGDIARSETAGERAQTLVRRANAAIDDGDVSTARELQNELGALLAELESSYEIRIVSRPNELSGVWRVPALNPSARNYYLIVEAIAPSGDVRSVRIENEEDGRYRTVSKWGLRVSEETFEQVAADKRDDGIIQDDVVGSKEIGYLEPTFRVPTGGATITEW